ncbi:MAG: rhodanese-like domain-containing protein [Steroidobacteraceae bacterium]
MQQLLEYATRHPWLVSATGLAFVMVLVYELRARSHAYAAVSPQEAIRLMNQHALVLDIRSPEQYAAGHVGGARHLPSAEILKAADTLKKHLGKPIVVYDESGGLGAAAARQLAAQGFTKAVNLRGGLAAWRAENLPVTRGAK